MEFGFVWELFLEILVFVVKPVYVVYEFMIWLDGLFGSGPIEPPE